MKESGDTLGREKYQETKASCVKILAMLENVKGECLKQVGVSCEENGQSSVDPSPSPPTDNLDFIL